MRKIRHRLVFVTLLFLLNTACDSEVTPDRGFDLTTLARNSEAYAQAKPGFTLVFPRDHGSHPDFRIEWWYLTANLLDQQGHPYGAQLTLFRLAPQPPGMKEPAYNWQSSQVFMAHFAITTPQDHVSFQRYARGAETPDMSRAGVTASPFFAWLDDWSMRSNGSDWLPIQVQARQDSYALNFQLTSEVPLVLQGDSGFSQKHPNGGGSYYYSQPFLKVEGELTVLGQQIAVSGDAWFDREWSSQFLQGGQVGWDWFSLHLESGEKLMLFQLRQQSANNSDERFQYASLIAPDGSSTALNPEQMQLVVLNEELVEGRMLPLHWRLRLPEVERDLEIKALHPNQWMDVDFPYWEGAVIVSGTGPGNRGRGYMELTGYPSAAGTER